MQTELFYITVKCLAAVCVIAGCAGIGFLKSREMTLRIETLQEFGQLLLALKNEIRYLGIPMPELFERLSVQCSEFYQPFVKTVAHDLRLNAGTSLETIWQTAAKNFFSKSCLKSEDIIWIEQCGKTLGYLDAKAQLQTIELQMKQLEEKLTQEKHQMTAKQRVYRCVGVFVGLLCAICLI